MWLRLAVPLLLLAVTACRGGPRVMEERGAGNEAQLAEASSRSGAASSRDRDRQGADDEERRGETTRVEELEGPEDEPELDLEIRVRDAYGYPAECLVPGAVRPGVAEFSLRLSVTMTATGTVTRSSVDAPVSAEADECLERRAARLRVAGPIPDAPRTVAVSIPVRAVSPAARAAVERDEEPEAPALPPGARPPGETLPAIVGEGPAPGAQAPAETLPAVVGDGPAPGALPPDTTLPARGAASDRDWMWISGSAEAQGDVPDTE